VILTHPRSAHDDVINAAAGALLVALSGARSFALAPSVHRVDYTQRTGHGRVVDTRGTRHLGGDMFQAKNGEVFRDPRGL
jgi:hypothetical protein